MRMNPIVKLAIEQAFHLTKDEKVQVNEIFTLCYEIDNYLKGKDRIIVMNALDLLKHFYTIGVHE